MHNRTEPRYERLIPEVLDDLQRARSSGRWPRASRASDILVDPGHRVRQDGGAEPRAAARPRRAPCPGPADPARDLAEVDAREGPGPARRPAPRGDARHDRARRRRGRRHRPRPRRSRQRPGRADRRRDRPRHMARCRPMSDRIVLSGMTFQARHGVDGVGEGRGAAVRGGRGARPRRPAGRPRRRPHADGRLRPASTRSPGRSSSRPRSTSSRPSPRRSRTRCSASTRRSTRWSSGCASRRCGSAGRWRTRASRSAECEIAEAIAEAIAERYRPSGRVPRVTLTVISRAVPRSTVIFTTCPGPVAGQDRVERVLRIDGLVLDPHDDVGVLQAGRLGGAARA